MKQLTIMNYLNCDTFIIIIKDQSGRPRTIRLRRVPRGQSKIIGKTRRKTKNQ